MSVVVYGPYVRKRDGRSHVIYYDTVTKTRRTQSYPRYLMEQKLGRELLPDEHIDHKNGDPTDNRLRNLQILTQVDNNRKAVVQGGRQAKLYVFNCPVCGVQKTIRYHYYKYRYLGGRQRGPYCSVSCAARDQWQRARVTE